jgi:murein DD-endopeptidase MepM/ murein hydrolase activator NlpD
VVRIGVATKHRKDFFAMDKKIKFTDQPTRVKVIYSAVIAVLCITAIVVGMVSAASKKNTPPDENVKPPISDGNTDEAPDSGDEKPSGDESKPEKLTFVSPVVGKVTKYHSLDTPVFSSTLNEWRVHSGIDISANEGSRVCAAADGQVTAVYSDPFLGRTVEITHSGGIVSVYSNLDPSQVKLNVGDTVKSGDTVGTVGDSSLSELADEPHLHFGVKVDGVSVNPLDYISEDSKSASLGITGS